MGNGRYHPDRGRDAEEEGAVARVGLLEPQRVQVVPRSSPGPCRRLRRGSRVGLRGGLACWPEGSPSACAEVPAIDRERADDRAGARPGAGGRPGPADGGRSGLPWLTRWPTPASNSPAEHLAAHMDSRRPWPHRPRDAPRRTSRVVGWRHGVSFALPGRPRVGSRRHGSAGPSRPG